MGHTQLVLATPERKRILRELLSHREPWSRSQRLQWRKMIDAEWYALAGAIDDHTNDETAESIERTVFSGLLAGGMPVAIALQRARLEAAADMKLPTRGERERDRRRHRREAVTAMDGRTAVTLGLVTECIVCGAELYWQQRSDSAYCSNACRQKAYRHRLRSVTL